MKGLGTFTLRLRVMAKDKYIYVELIIGTNNEVYYSIGKIMSEATMLVILIVQFPGGMTTKFDYLNG